VPSCSVLVRLVEGRLVVGHSTWHDYRALGYRLTKLYSLPFPLPGGGQVPGHTIALTGYPATLYSLDDFYVLSSGLITTESTLFVHRKELYLGNVPEGSVWEGVRAMVANRLAGGGGEWGELFGRHNSGTYNNQWMVAAVAAGRLWVTEQLPGVVTSREVTATLRAVGYWASYNRPAFPATLAASGAADMVARHGGWFSHEDTPRARLFAKGHTQVASYFALSPLSKGPLPDLT